MPLNLPPLWPHPLSPGHPLDNLTTTKLIQPNMFVGSGWDEVKIAFPINIFSVHSSHIAICYPLLPTLQLTLTREVIGSSLLTSAPHTIVCILILNSMSFSDFRGTVGLRGGSQCRARGPSLILPQRTNNKPTEMKVWEEALKFNRLQL